jgi:hypothetical protein
MRLNKGRYVLKSNGHYVKWTTWIASMIPSATFTDNLQYAQVFTSDNLNVEVKNDDETTRLDMFMSKYSDVEIIRIQIVEVDKI